MERLAVIISSKGLKLTIVGIVLIMFFGYLQYQSYISLHFSINKRIFASLPTYREYMKEQNGVIPGLGLAQSFHLVTHSDKIIPITERQRDLQVKDLWITNHSMYLTYSLNINKSDKKPEDIPILKFSKVFYHFKDGTSQQGTVTINQKYINKGHAVGHRFYQSLYLNTKYTRLKNQIDLSKKLSTLQSVTIIQPRLETGYTHKNIMLSAMTLPAKFTPDSRVLKTVTVNQTIPITYQSTVNIKDIKIQNFSTVIDLTLNQHNQQNIQEVLFNVSSLNHNYGMLGAYFQGSHQEIIMQPIKSMPSVLSLQPIKYMSKPNDNFEFNAEQLINKNQMNNRIKIGTVKGREVDAKIGPIPNELHDPNHVLITVWIKLDLSKQPTGYKVGHSNTSFSSGVRVTKDSHQLIKSLKLFDWNQNNNEEKISFSVTKEEIFESKTLTITITPIYYLTLIPDSQAIHVLLK